MAPEKDSGSKQLPLLRRRILAISHEVLRNLDTLHQLEESFPRLRTPRQNHIASRRITSHINLRAFKAKFSRQPNRLAAAIRKQFCRTQHGIYHDIYPNRSQQSIIIRPTYANVPLPPATKSQAPLSLTIQLFRAILEQELFRGVSSRFLDAPTEIAPKPFWREIGDLSPYS
jgi:hypothetical protein